MRRASTCLAVIGLAVLALPGVASAAPTVTFKAQAVPITGFPHTGNILGAGAAVLAEYKIEGTEYGGFPPPIIGVNFYLPTGSEAAPVGLPDMREDRARTVRAQQMPEELGGRARRQSARHRCLRQRTS